ncbi:MAG: hypothetical protein JST42_11325 [Bacteroidetes bacterium]|nr:hypothetical protein [Bacteroidota bacterium]
MKTALKIAAILSWFNLIFWGVNLISALPTIAKMDSVMVISLVLMASIPLNAYAGLQLHKSIRHPAAKLNSQTPTGIRFVGLVAEFIGFLLLLVGLAIVLNPERTLTAIKDAQNPVFKDRLDTIQAIKFIGGFFIFLGVAVCVNAVLNFRLLRWYYLVRQSDVTSNDDARPNDQP